MAAKLNSDRLHEAGVGSFFRPSQVGALGITYDQLRCLESAGTVERVARGLYRLAEAEPTEHHSLAAVCARVPHSIVCLLSALEVHEIGTQVPQAVWLAIHHKARAPRITGTEVRLLRVQRGCLDVWGFRIRRSKAYQPASRRRLAPSWTVSDSKHLLGREAALEALYDALRLRKVTVADLDRTLKVLPSRLLNAALETREP